MDGAEHDYQLLSILDEAIERLLTTCSCTAYEMNLQKDKAVFTCAVDGRMIRMVIEDTGPVDTLLPGSL